MLATPNRGCSVTKVRLPRGFLQSFELVAHPETGDPWWVPSDLSPARPAAPTRVTGPMPPSVDTAPVASSDVPPAVIGARGPTAYALASMTLLRLFSGASGKYRKGYKSFYRSSSSPGSAAVLNNAVWRADMDAHVLELTRRRVFEDLLHFSSLCEEGKRQYLVPFTTCDQLEGLHQRGCVLLAGSGSANGENKFERPNSKTRTGGRSTEIPIYALRDLLGCVYAENLCTKSPVFQTSQSVLLRGQRTVKLQERLWKLYGYCS
ncbi:hypothetical protein SPI_07521 [Niveomyces insectorum RCEF 264]|uniref:Uncharacterized protein n=1 Tax=Niveomyces insectorum RCEF 264 TaxID=1081102 RepID=A0A167PCB4_9HYPO|nr:hypothetical protein SPI_07521 [Niveomyces insectorum RCEF 264]